MLESFVTAFIIYFVVIDPIGNAPVFLAVTSHLDRSRKLRVAIEGSAIATAIMLFFALCGAWVLSYLKISEAAFKIAGDKAPSFAARASWTPNWGYLG